MSKCLIYGKEREGCVGGDRQKHTPCFPKSHTLAVLTAAPEHWDFIRKNNFPINTEKAPLAKTDHPSVLVILCCCGKMP